MPRLDDVLRHGERLYAIVDAARDQGALEWAKSSGMEFACLFTGITAISLARVAPYLVWGACDEELLGSWTERVHGSSSGILLATDATFESLRVKLKKNLTVDLDKGRSAYFRYYDPRVLRSFLRKATLEQFNQLFGDEVLAFFMETEAGEFLGVRKLPVPASVMARVVGTGFKVTTHAI